MKLVQGIGINDRSIKCKEKGAHTKEYKLWHSLLSRIYGEANLLKQPTYVNCSISDCFRHYHLFHKWCQDQIGFGEEGYQLDKDLLIKGNKTYSEDLCVFIPKDINILLTNSKASRGKYPLGVSEKGSRFQASCSIQGKNAYIGTFDTPNLAFQAYKTFKEAHIKELAELYKGSIDPRAYTALINYTVELDD